MNLKTVLVSIIFTLQFSLSLGLAQDLEKEIRAEGVADITAGNVSGARDRAIEDALRKAVEDGVGLLLSSESIVENYQLIQDTILSKSEGYIKNYKILHEEQKGWMYKVTIMAKIGTTLLKNDLDALRRIKDLKGNPRVMIIIDERVEGGGKLTETENALIQKFIDKEFKIVDPKTVKQSIERDRLMMAIEKDNEAAAALGLQHGADMVIMGTTVSTTHATQVSGVDLKSISLSTTARVIRADTGEVLIGKTETARAPQATSFGRQLAVEEICDNLSSYLIPKIVEIWNYELINLNSITLTAIGLDSYDKIAEIKRFLKANIRNLKRIYDRGFVQKAAKFELMIRGGSAKKLAEDLSVKKGPDYRFEVKNMDANSLTVMMLPLRTDELITLTVKGLDSYDKLVETKRFLQSNIKGLKKIIDRGFVQNTSKLDLIIQEGGAHKLAEDLSVNKGPDYRFEVKNVEANSLTVMMLPLSVETPAVGKKKSEPEAPVQEESEIPEPEKPETPEAEKPKAPAEEEISETEAPVQEESEIPEPEKPKDYVRVKVNWMNVREFPGPGFKKLGQAKRGEQFPFISTVHPRPGTTWHEINFKGKRGFIWHKGVEVIKNP